MKKKCVIYFREGGFLITKINTKKNDPKSLAKRMAGGGYVVAGDDMWGKKRTIPINLSDVYAIVIEK